MNEEDLIRRSKEIEKAEKEIEVDLIFDEEEISDIDHIVEANALLAETLEFLEKDFTRSPSARAWTRKRSLEKLISDYLEQFE